MNEFKLLPDDPKLTAYALGELDGDERATVEAALRQNPALGAVVEEIRAMAGQLERALASEPGSADGVGLPLAGRPVQPAIPDSVVIPGAGVIREPGAIPGPATSAGPTRGGAAGDPYSKKKTAKLLQFPQVYYVVGGLAAACFALVFALRAPAPKAVEKHYVEIPLAPLAPSEKSAEENSSAAEAVAVALPKVEENVASTSTPTVTFEAKASGLLDQAKAAGETHLAERLAAPMPLEREVKRIAVEKHTSAAPAEMTLAKMESKAGGSRKKWEYPADEGFVIEAKPKSGPTMVAPMSRFLAERDREPTSASPGSVLLSAQAPSLVYGTPASPGETTSRVFDFGAVHGYINEPKGEFGATGAVLANPASSNLGTWSSYFGAQPPTGLGKDRHDTEAYAYRADNDFLAAKDNPLSTFSADVDTASYANVRRMLLDGKRPPADAVRIEELLNYFPFAYAGPAAAKRGEGTAPTSAEAAPFAATMEMAEAPWATNHRLVRIGLKGREVTTAERGAANLVFLLDVSGSMSSPNKLPLVQESMRLLLARLRPDDRVAIVVYAGASGLALPSTPVAKAREISAAIDELTQGGSTNGAMGIQLAYDIAKANFVAGGINRVVLCTDGDFNVGTTSEGDLVRLITEKAKSKVFLTVLGFGMGNYKDATLQQLADAGNGNYGYVDTRREAEKLLVEQVSGTLVTIAKDVKLQVEFNPAKVASYRLIGYEKRLLKKEDFNNDKVDAGEIGAGHSVTALYEIVPVGAVEGKPAADRVMEVEELRYTGFGSAPMTMRTTRPEVADELLTLKVRYKEPSGDASKRLEFPLADRSRTFAAASADFKFAAAVAGFGMILRDSPHKGTATLADVAGWAEAGIGADPGGYRAEFLGLVKRARALE
jgi:secreted protein with Ig-like and vWFA domain